MTVDNNRGETHHFGVPLQVGPQTVKELHAIVVALEDRIQALEALMALKASEKSEE